MNFIVEIPKEKTSVWEHYVPIIKSTDNKVIHAYLHGNILGPEEYSELCFSLYTAETGSDIYIHINSEGGIVDSAFMIYSAIMESKATVHSILTGTVASAASVIALACDTLTIKPFTNFMAHNYSHGASGSGAQVKDYVNYIDKEFTTAAKKIYTPFLTPEELISISTLDKEVWLNAEDVQTRWDRVLTIRYAHKKKSSNNEH